MPIKMDNLQVITIIQARTTSSRLPNKVLMHACEKPLLLLQIERIIRATSVGKVVVATTILSEDDPIVELCNDYHVTCFRGHPTDLLDRHYQCAKEMQGDVVVKIPSDCPLIDPTIIDSVLQYYLKNHSYFDYVSNLHPATFPDGNDVEVMSFDALEVAWKEATRDFEREHTTPFIWENQDRFRIGSVFCPMGQDLSFKYRWTLDYIEDYMLIKEIFSHLYLTNSSFGMNDIIQLMEAEPYLLNYNSMYVGRFWYENYFDQLQQIEEYKLKYKNYEN